MKVLAFLAELFYWFNIFLCPVLIMGTAAYIVYKNYPSNPGFILSVTIASLGVITGIYFAERIRRTIGCATFMTRITGGENKRE